MSLSFFPTCRVGDDLFRRVDFALMLPAVENEFIHPHREKHVRVAVKPTGSPFLLPLILLDDGRSTNPRKTTSPAGQRNSPDNEPRMGFKKVAQGQSRRAGTPPWVTGHNTPVNPDGVVQVYVPCARHRCPVWNPYRVRPVGDRPYPGWRPPEADLPRAIIFNAVRADSSHEDDVDRADADFVDNILSRLMDKGVSVWLDRHDLAAQPKSFDLANQPCRHWPWRPGRTLPLRCRWTHHG